jgi:hypothetical protein
VAVLVLDACRYELGCRLAAMLNEGEPATRAEVLPAVAPLPSITDLGMAFALGWESAQIAVRLQSGNWLVTAEGFPGNLAQAEQRREWLRQHYKLRDRAILSVDDVLSHSSDPLSVKALGRLIFVFGDELDSDGHEGRLKIAGSGYQAYGGLGYFHGGATLQELVIPVVTVSWPRKSQKIPAVLKPIERIERMLQKIEVASGAVQQDLVGGVDDALVSRSVLVKAIDTTTGKTLFKTDPATLEPGGGALAMTLRKVPGAQGKFGSEVHLQLLDADDDELLETAAVRLSVELDEWD